MLKSIYRCKRCGRVLSNKEAKKLGYGKTCYAKMLEQNAHRITMQDFFEGDEE